MNIRIEEVLRYLGYRKNKHDIDDISLQQIKDCIKDMEKVSLPKYTFKRFPLFIDEDIHISSMTIHSQGLKRNLRHCEEVYLIAATLGIEVDRLIRKSELMNMSKAVIYQAIGAEMIEQVVNNLNEKLLLEVKKEGKYLKSRYSPGYGDVDLSHQKDFEELLHMSKECGINLTDTYLMIPSKSVTAFIGISDQPTHKVTDCAVCDKLDCIARKEPS